LKKKIAVMDSGVGGLTIYHAIQKSIPEVDVVFDCDKENFPYGSKPESLVNQIATAFAKKMFQEHRPDILVVACNTISTIALKSIRDSVSCPIVGVVPAIKPAAQLSKSKIIGLLATETTINQAYIDQLEKDFAAHCQLIRVASKNPAHYAEDKLAGKSLSDDLILKEIKPLFKDGLDVVVLGCTHYTHLVEDFKRVQPWEVTWLDSTQAIVDRVKFLLRS